MTGLMLCEETDSVTLPMVHWQYTIISSLYIGIGGVNLGSHTDASQHSANTDTPHYHIQIWDLGERVGVIHKRLKTDSQSIGSQTLTLYLLNYSTCLSEELGSNGSLACHDVWVVGRRN